MNNHLKTILVAPLTSRGVRAPFRVRCRFEGTDGQIALDHIRSVDKRRLARQLGCLDQATAQTVLATLREMFAE